ncbi:hypothetical protein [Burkholderia oklahomensis]|uniref:hypothetical protein n=1 Tax=Burkholderia oklahomensis TaxID=342113 RepID=UPI00139246AE|nr:hypothetical protein [Burkholderia oklahomensis]MBI0362698.1 hypothetical protein [Burkholderia oklahomensis]
MRVLQSAARGGAAGNHQIVAKNAGARGRAGCGAASAADAAAGCRFGMAACAASAHARGGVAGPNATGDAVAETAMLVDGRIGDFCLASGGRLHAADETAAGIGMRIAPGG